MRRSPQRTALKPLGRLVAWATAGVDPTIMGIGPVPASRRALAPAGLELAQMDLVEINEAFAAQYLAVEKELGLDRERTNVDGGAVAMGHPLGASGARHHPAPAARPPAHRRRGTGSAPPASAGGRARR